MSCPQDLIQMCVCLCFDFSKARTMEFYCTKMVTTIEINVLKVKDSVQMYVSKRVMLDFYHPSRDRY